MSDDVLSSPYVVRVLCTGLVGKTIPSERATALMNWKGVVYMKIMQLVSLGYKSRMQTERDQDNIRSWLYVGSANINILRLIDDQEIKAEIYLKNVDAGMNVDMGINADMDINADMNIEVNVKPINPMINYLRIGADGQFVHKDVFGGC
jgi:hypothetical protein